jgi:uncharacterized membrane protein
MDSPPAEGFRLPAFSPQGQSLHLAVHWAADTPLLPHFNGTLRFRIADGRTRIVLDGSYVPPGGALGRIFDAVLGHRIALRTCEDLVRRLAADLTERERTWRS